MGTKYHQYFTDETFSSAIRVSAIKVFASCLADLTIFAAANVSKARDLTAKETATLAQHCYREGLRRTLPPEDFRHLPADCEGQFADRAKTTIWANAALGEASFAGSGRDLVRFAPVIDEYKALDGGIVSNSIRLRWDDVRDQLLKRIDGAAIIADWRDVAPHQAEDAASGSADPTEARKPFALRYKRRRT